MFMYILNEIKWYYLDYEQVTLWTLQTLMLTNSAHLTLLYIDCVLSIDCSP